MKHIFETNVSFQRDPEIEKQNSMIIMLDNYYCLSEEDVLNKKEIQKSKEYQDGFYKAKQLSEVLKTQIKIQDILDMFNYPPKWFFTLD